MLIPAFAHFIWFGRTFAWVHWLAVRSAVERGGFDRVFIHHADDLRGEPWFRAATELPSVEAVPLRPEELLTAGSLPEGLVPLYHELSEPAARANVLRAAVLQLQGGVYLDFDTVTLRSLTPLRAGAGVFCGAERLSFPAHVRRSHNPLRLGTALARTTVRDLCRRLPEGWRCFRRIERLYPSAVNNAVLGAAPRHPFLNDLLERMVGLPPERRRARYALGTHLLQEAVRAYASADLVVHGPDAFYPLGPEISEHWFRAVSRPRLDQVLGPETRVVHWYASVRTKHLVPQIDPAWVRAWAPRQLFSAMAVQFLDP